MWLLNVSMTSGCVYKRRTLLYVAIPQIESVHIFNIWVFFSVFCTPGHPEKEKKRKSCQMLQPVLFHLSNLCFICQMSQPAVFHLPDVSASIVSFARCLSQYCFICQMSQPVLFHLPDVSASIVSFAKCQLFHVPSICCLTCQILHLMLFHVWLKMLSDKTQGSSSLLVLKCTQCNLFCSYGNRQ